MSCQFASGTAIADFDGDGFTDLLVMTAAVPVLPSDLNGCDEELVGRPVLLRGVPNTNRWLTVRPRGSSGTTDPVGAVVRAYAEGMSQHRWILRGTSFLSTETPWPTFGLGTLDAAEVCVQWPDGEGEYFGSFQAGQAVALVEGQGLGAHPCTHPWTEWGDLDTGDTGDTGSAPSSSDTGITPSDGSDTGSAAGTDPPDVVTSGHPGDEGCGCVASPGQPTWMWLLLLGAVTRGVHVLAGRRGASRPR